LATLDRANIVRRTGAPVQRITLEIIDEYTFLAGQYLQVQGPGKTLVPMSIASAPLRLPELELHYHSTPGVPEAAVMDAMLEGEQLLITEAAGNATAGPTDQSLFIIAGGSGAAQAFSCAEDRSARGASAPTTILWCADSAAEIYGTDELRSFAHVSLHVCIDARRGPENDGLAWLRANAPAHRGARVILAGGPGFVYAATDTLLASGYVQSELCADVYDYAPRS